MKKDRFGKARPDDYFDLDKIGRGTTEKEMIDAIARAELIDEIPDDEQGCCLDDKKVKQRIGAITTWLNAHRNKDPFRTIYTEELAREQENPDPCYHPLMIAIFRFRKEHGITISKKTAGRYLKKDDPRPRRNRI